MLRGTVYPIPVDSLEDQQTGYQWSKTRSGVWTAGTAVDLELRVQADSRVCGRGCFGYQGHEYIELGTSEPCVVDNAR